MPSQLCLQDASGNSIGTLVGRLAHAHWNSFPGALDWAELGILQKLHRFGKHLARCQIGKLDVKMIRFLRVFHRRAVNAAVSCRCVSTGGPSSTYESLVSNGSIIADKVQLKAVTELQQLYDKILEYKAVGSSINSRFLT